MRRILSERNLVVILFFLALIVFVFAQSQTKQMEMLYMEKGSAISTLSIPHEPLTKMEAGSLPNLALVPAH
jgi:hypothetical protein